MAEETAQNNQSGVIRVDDNKTDKSKLWIRRFVRILSTIIATLVILIGMSYVAYRIAQTVQKRLNPINEVIGVDALPTPFATFDFEQEFRVNTANNLERHFIRAEISLAYNQENPIFLEELRKRKPQMRSIINFLLMSKTKEALASLESRILLQEEIRASINHVLIEGKITDVYFSSFLLN